MIMKKIKNLISKYPFLKFLVNRYILILIVFGIWMLFFDNYSDLEHRILDKEINEIEDNINYYRSEIKKDSTSIKHLKNDNRVEKYAREKYFMKRENEDIYIIDYEDNMKDSVITKQDKISNN